MHRLKFKALSSYIQTGTNIMNLLRLSSKCVSQTSSLWILVDQETTSGISYHDFTILHTRHVHSVNPDQRNNDRLNISGLMQRLFLAEREREREREIIF